MNFWFVLYLNFSIFFSILTCSTNPTFTARLPHTFIFISLALFLPSITPMFSPSFFYSVSSFRHSIFRSCFINILEHCGFLLNCAFFSVHKDWYMSYCISQFRYCVRFSFCLETEWRNFLFPIENYSNG